MTFPDLFDIKKAVFSTLDKEVEPRRKGLLFQHIVYLILFIAWIAIASKMQVFIFNFLSGLLSDQSVQNSYINDKSIKDLSNVISYFLIPVIFLVKSLHVTKLYKNDSSNNVIVGESLKNFVFSKIVGFYGDYTFSDEQDINPTVLIDAKLISNFSKFYSEDVIYGKYNNCIIRAGEVFVTSETKKKSNFKGFSGIIIVIDFSNPDVQLRRDFRGKTVVINDEKKLIDKYKFRFKDYSSVALPNSSLEQKFEVFTDDEKEAKEFLSEELFAIITELSDTIKKANKQHLHLDDKIFGTFQNVGKALFENILSIIPKIILFPFMLPFMILSIGSKSDVRVNRKILRDFDRKNLNVENNYSNFELALCGDKVIAKIPHDKNLFQLNSIYQMPVIEEDVEIIHQIMLTAQKLTDYTVKHRV